MGWRRRGRFSDIAATPPASLVARPRPVRADEERGMTSSIGCRRHARNLRMCKVQRRSAGAVLQSALDHANPLDAAPWLGSDTLRLHQRAGRWGRDMIAIDSNSVGDPDRFRTLADLEEMLRALPGGREDHSRVALLMRRREGGQREVVERVVLAPETGVPGDAWWRAEQPRRDMQIAVMQRDVAELIANGQPLALFGDCLILDLDLSAANVPAGSLVRVGGAILEVTPMPHNGCRKFR